MKSPTKDAIARPIGRPAPLPTPIPIPGPIGQPGGIQPAATDPPSVTGTKPSHQQAGMPLEIDGMNFENVQHVFIGGIDVQNFNVASSTMITTTVPSQLSPGTAIIQVQTKLDSGSIATSPGFAGFTVDPPTFCFTGFTPNQGRPGDTITLFGCAFSRLQSVTFNRAQPIPRSAVTVQSETVATVKVPQDAQSGPITLSDGPDNPQQQGFILLPQPYVFDEPDEFDPTQGVIGTLVTIHGKHLASVDTVIFHQTVVPKDQRQVGASQKITANVPMGATTGPITLKGPNGSVTSMKDFTVILTPVLESVKPASGRVGDKVVLNGRHLGEVTSINFGGVILSMPAFKDKSEKKITLKVPANVPTGPVTITVTNDAGTASIGFTVTS
jgi:large repetitive protein